MDNWGGNAGVLVAPGALSRIRLKVAVGPLLLPRPCAAPSLDGAARALLCVELKPCRLHVVLLRRANCWICKRDVMALMKVVIE